MTLGTDNGQTACCLHFGRQLDVGTTTGHVGGNGHGTALTSQCHNFRFLLVQLGIQHIMGNLAHGQHLAQHFGDFDRSGTHQYRAASLDHLHDFLNNSLVFLTLGLVDTVVHVDTGNGTVGRNHHDIELVDVPEFAGFGFCRTSHTAQLVVHTEIVLQGDGGKRLGGRLYLHAFLGFHGLMQAVAPAASVHDTARLFVHNHDLTVHDHIVGILFEHRVGLQQLVDGMHPFGLDGEIRHQLVLAGQFLFVRQLVHVLQFGKLGSDVGQDEQGRILRVAGYQVDTLVGQFHALQLLVDDKVERLYGFGHPLVVLFHIDFLGLQHAGLDARFAEELDEGLVLGQRLVAAIERQESGLHVLLLVGSDETLGIGQELGSQPSLGFHQTYHQRAEHFEKLFLTAGHGTGNDERSTGIVNQHRVHLIDNCIIVLALHQVAGTGSHIVAQIIETEFVVGTEGDVGHISPATSL